MHLDTPPPAPCAAPLACPLCSKPNHCALAAGDQAEADCWCFHAYFPLGLLAQLPTGQHGIACVCPECVLAFDPA